MSLFLSALIYLLMGAVLVGGLLMLMAGKPILLIVGFLVYVVMLAKIGCLTH